MAATQQQVDESRRAEQRARAILRPGDRIVARSGCGPHRAYKFAGFEGCWIISAGGVSDLHAMSITKLNGTPITFRDVIKLGRREVLRFIRYPHEVNDGTCRCIRCGQIDDEPYHDAEICRTALEPYTPPPMAPVAPGEVPF